MSVFLGIDTGGTYTDAVLFDPDRGLLSQAKALTRRHDLTLGIRESVARALHGRSSAEVELVSLSTTLATNAVVEMDTSLRLRPILAAPSSIAGRITSRK